MFFYHVRNVKVVQHTAMTGMDYITLHSMLS